MVLWWVWIPCARTRSASSPGSRGKPPAPCNAGTGQACSPRIRDAFRRLTERGLLTCIQNPVKGRNYGAYMLLLGDDAENNEILDYNRACLLEMYKAHVYEPVTRRAEPEDDATNPWIETDNNDDSVWGL